MKTYKAHYKSHGRDKTMETFKTEKQIRNAFWQGNKHLQKYWRESKTQNEYNATIRSEWVDFVDMLQKDGHISEKLADEVTL
jgi:hypothetical protein